MEKWRKLLLLGCGLILLSGCGQWEEDPYRVDTVVQIPVNPTQAPTQVPEITESAELEATEGTESTQAASSSGSKSSSSAKSSSGSKSSSGNKSASGSKSNSTSDTRNDTKATAPPATEPEITEPQVTEPTETEPAETEPAYNPSSYSVGSLEYAILDVMNSYRGAAGLSALTISKKLCGIAALRAREVQQLWSHTRPDGRNFTSVLGDYGFGYSTAAENLSYTIDSTAEAIVAKWMNTDSMNNILNGSFTTAGIGVYSSDGMTYISNILVG